MRTDARRKERVPPAFRARPTSRLHRDPFTKAVALLTLGAFLLTLVPAPAVAVPAGEKQAPREREGSPAGFLLPRSLGRVTGAGFFGGDTLVVEIQDLHCHGEVQRNISGILALLGREAPLLQVYQEGAAGQVDTSWLAAVPGGKLRTDILDSLLNEGRLTGAEHYSFVSGRYRLVRGLEDGPLYDANVLRLARGLADRPLTDALLREMSARAAGLEARYFSRPNRRLSALAAKYADGSLPAKEYARLLVKMHRRNGTAAGRFPALSAYRELAEREKDTDFEAIGRELRELSAELKRDLPYRDYRSLLERTEELSRLEELPAVLASLGLSSRVDAYPRLKGFFEYLALSGSVNPLALLREERKLSRDLRFGFARSESEREVVFISDYLRRLEDFLNNRITPEDYGYFSDQFERFRFLWAKHAGGDSLEKLLPYCRLMDDYYRANLERNRAFFRNAGLGEGAGAGAPPRTGEGAAERAAALLGSGAKVIVTVTGGFHAPGFLRLLEENGISYLEITPNVTGETGAAEEVYTELIARQGRLLSQAMAASPLSQGGDPSKLAGMLGAFIADRLGRGAARPEIEEQLKAAVESGPFRERFGEVGFALHEAGRRGADRVFRFSVTARENGAAVTRRYAGENDRLSEETESTSGKRTVPLLAQGKELFLSLLGRGKDSRDDGAEDGCIGKFDRVSLVSAEDLPNGLVKVSLLLKKQGGGTFAEASLYGARAPREALAEDFSTVSRAPGFENVRRLLDGFLQKNAGGIDDIIFDGGEFSPGSGLALADIGGAGGVQMLNGRPLRVLRRPLAAERVARFHELAHMAYAAGALRLEDVLSAVTDKGIREALYDAKLRGGELPEAARFHHALRAFQRQYFGDEDARLSRKIRRLARAGDRFPPQWFRGMRTYYAFLRDVVDPSSGRPADSFGTFTDLKFLFRHVKAMGLNAVFLMPLCEPASFDFKIDGSPYCALSAYALDPRHVDWKAAGLAGKTLFDRAQEFGRRPPVDFAALANDPHIVRYAHVKALRALANGDYRRQGGYDLPGRADADFEKYRSLPFKDFGDLSSPVTASDEYQQLFRMVLMEQYFARRQLAEAVSLARELGVSVGFDHPFLRSMNGTEAAFNPGIFDRRYDGHIRAAGYDIGGRNQQLWGDEETQEGLARYNWDEVRRQGYEPLIGPIKYFVEQYGFDFVRGDALHFGYGQDGFYEALAGYCRENGVLLVPETLGGGAEVNERCEALGMVPIETPSGPRGWKGAPTVGERWQELFHYLAGASKDRVVWNPVHHDALTTAGEFEPLFEAGVPLDVRLKVLYALFGLALPNYSVFFGDEYGRTERINTPGVAHAWKKDSPYVRPGMDLTAHLARINELREKYPYLGDPGLLKYWSVSGSEVSFVRGSGNGEELKVTIDLSTGRFSAEEFALPGDGKIDAQELARAAKMLSHFHGQWAGELYAIYKTRENDGQFRQAFGDALLLLLFDKDEGLRRGAAWVLSKPEFAGPLEHAGLNGWQDRSALNVLLYWENAQDNPWLVERAFRAAGAEKQRWIAAQILSAALCAETEAQRTRALKALYGVFGRYDESPLELVHRFDRKLSAVLQKRGDIALLRRSAKELGIVPELGTVTAGLREASKHFLYDDPSLGGWTVVAGSPHFDQRNGAWLSNWGRDTMISLPGLCLAAGREDIFRSVMLNYLRFVKDGLLPNFVGDGKNPGFNSVDASMWLFLAVGEYLKKTGDYAFLSSPVDRRSGGRQTVRQVLEEIITRYRDGTEFSFQENGRTVTARVRMDDDGLISAGDPHTQLTWMDGKPDNGEPVTSRYGKAVEVNALWYNALGVMADICRRENNAKAGEYAELARRVKESFDRFWNEEEQCLYDTVDGDEAAGARVRPNQLYAVSLGLLDRAKAAKVVEKARRELFTRYGMRTLSPRDPAYQGVHRDVSTYHQGTIWPWPAGAFIEAHRRVYGAAATRQFLEDTGYLTTTAEFLEALHSVPEILNGDCESSRHWNTLGCGQQAWSVAAPLYALAALEARQNVSVGGLAAAGAAAGLLAAAVCFIPLFPALGALAGTVAAGGAAVSSAWLLGAAAQLRLSRWLAAAGFRKAPPLGEREGRIHRFRQLVSSRGLAPVSDDTVGVMEADPSGKTLRYNPEAVVTLGDITARAFFLLHERTHFGRFQLRGAAKAASFANETVAYARLALLGPAFSAALLLKAGIDKLRALTGTRLREKARPALTVTADTGIMGEAAARQIAALIRENNGRGRPTVLGLATGSTPLALYRELIRMHDEEGLDFSRVATFNLDEYAGLPADHPQSYRYFMEENLFKHLAGPAGIRPENIHFLDGMAKDLAAECRRYEEEIRRAGGIDLQVLGIGENGHIAFNEPGSSVRSRTRAVALTEDTRRANSRFFDGDMAQVPKEALSMGIGTILEARRVILLSNGPKKARAVQRSLYGPLTESVPASLLRTRKNVHFIVEKQSFALSAEKEAEQRASRAAPAAGTVFLKEPLCMYTHEGRLENFDRWFGERFPLARGVFADLGIGMEINADGIPAPATSLELAGRFPALSVVAVDRTIPHAAVRRGNRWGIFDRDGKLVAVMCRSHDTLRGYALENEPSPGKALAGDLLRLYHEGVGYNPGRHPSRTILAGDAEILFQPYELARRNAGAENIRFVQAEFRDLPATLGKTAFDYGRIFNVNMHYGPDGARKNLEDAARLFKDGGMLFEGQNIGEMNELLFAAYRVEGARPAAQDVWLSEDYSYIFDEASPFAGDEFLPSFLRLSGAQDFLDDLYEARSDLRERGVPLYSPLHYAALLEELRKRGYETRESAAVPLAGLRITAAPGTARSRAVTAAAVEDALLSAANPFAVVTGGNAALRAVAGSPAKTWIAANQPALEGVPFVKLVPDLDGLDAAARENLAAEARALREAGAGELIIVTLGRPLGKGLPGKLALPAGPARTASRGLNAGTLFLDARVDALSGAKVFRLQYRDREPGRAMYVLGRGSLALLKQLQENPAWRETAGLERLGESAAPVKVPGKSRVSAVIYSDDGRAAASALPGAFDDFLAQNTLDAVVAAAPESSPGMGWQESARPSGVIALGQDGGLTELLARSGALLASKNADCVSRAKANIIVSRSKIPPAELSGYLRDLKEAVQAGTLYVQLEDFFEPGGALLREGGEAPAGTSRSDAFREKHPALEKLVRESARDEQAVGSQMARYAAVREALEFGRGAGFRLLATRTVSAGADLERESRSADALLELGFGGLEFDLRGTDLDSPRLLGWLAALAPRLRSVNPEAVVAVSLPEGASAAKASVEALCREDGVRLLERRALDSGQPGPAREADIVEVVAGPGTVRSEREYRELLEKIASLARGAGFIKIDDRLVSGENGAANLELVSSEAARIFAALGLRPQKAYDAGYRSAAAYAKEYLPPFSEALAAGARRTLADGTAVDSSLLFLPLAVRGSLLKKDEAGRRALLEKELYLDLAFDATAAFEGKARQAVEAKLAALKEKAAGADPAAVRRCNEELFGFWQGLVERVMTEQYLGRHAPGAQELPFADEADRARFTRLLVRAGALIRPAEAGPAAREFDPLEALPGFGTGDGGEATAPAPSGRPSQETLREAGAQALDTGSEESLAHYLALLEGAAAAMEREGRTADDLAAALRPLLEPPFAALERGEPMQPGSLAALLRLFELFADRSKDLKVLEGSVDTLDRLLRGTRAVKAAA